MIVIAIFVILQELHKVMLYILASYLVLDYGLVKFGLLGVSCTIIFAS